MRLSDFDLQQLDEQKLTALPAEQKDARLIKLLGDLKEARDRLRANSQTSSRPPSSDPLWSGTGGAGGEAVPASSAEDPIAVTATDETKRPAEPAGGSAPALDPGSAPKSPAPAGGQLPQKTLGRKVGAPGHSRSLTLPVMATVVHAPKACVVCGQALEPAAFRARTGL